MNSEDVTIISVVGKQNAGKTTLIKELIPRLKKRGYRVGTLKYSIREFEIDHEGKDTYKYFCSGADTVAISSQDKVAVIKRVENSPQISEIVERYFNDVSVMLVEGYRSEEYPVIKIIYPQRMEIVGKNSDNELLLVRENTETKRFSEEDMNKALGFVEGIISHNNRAVIQKNV
jgi:molybdopterin-guanine dinucleotide biosynthesis adapter protein